MTGCGVNFEAIEGRALKKCPVGIFSEGASQKGRHKACSMGHGAGSMEHAGEPPDGGDTVP